MISKETEIADYYWPKTSQPHGQPSEWFLAAIRDAFDSGRADERARVVAGGTPEKVPEQDEPPPRRHVTESDVQELLGYLCHRGDGFNLRRAREMGYKISLSPNALVGLVQTFLDAETTRSLLRGTVDGWKSRTQRKLAWTGWQPDASYLADVCDRIIEMDGCCAHDWLVGVAKHIKQAFPPPPAAKEQTDEP